MRAFSRSYTGPLLPVILLVSCFFSSTQAFFPSDWREKYFGNGGVSHEAQTRIAYDALTAKYFPDISPLTTNMIKARTTMAEANMEVDDDQTSSAKHFDGENFDGGQALLVQAKTNVIDAVRDGNGQEARKFLGAALHTLQDFYAHTNWVELGNSDINYDLGKDGVRLSLVTFGMRTCNECGFGGLERLARGCHDCTTNTDGFNMLTSGYYEGEDSPPGSVDIPDWKCRHGGATDSALGAIAGVFGSSTFRDVTPGINKDSLNCFWSPHHFHHPTAVALAARSSIQYIEDIVAEGSLTDKERKILFGVGTTLAFAIDTTGSMASIIASTREQAIAIARARIGTKDEPIDYVVAPFSDPSTGPVLKTADFDSFVANVGTLSAAGGGDCPELAINGVLDALEVMEGPSDLFIMTDATAKDYDLAPTAVEIAFKKQIRFHVFKFDSNCDDGIASKRDTGGLERRVDSDANRQYSLLAASTGGTYHSLPLSDVGSISSLLDVVTLSESNTILTLSGTLNSTSSFEVPVDSKMTEFTISLRGAGVTVSLTKPDGSVLDTSSAGVTLTTVTDGRFLNVKAPASGTWSLTLNLVEGTTGVTFACDVTGVSPLHLSKFNFVALRGRPGHKGYYPLPSQPAYNHDVAAVAVMDGDFEIAVFDLRDPLAVHAVDTNMAQGTGAEGAPPKSSFYGEMRLTNAPLYAYVEGTDDAGAPFQRVLVSVFQPLLSNTTETGFNSTDVWAGRNTTNVTVSSTISHSSTSTVSNHTSSTLIPIYPTGTGNSTHESYPTTTSASKSGHYYSGYPVPIYTWGHTTYNPTSSYSIKTHTKYVTEGCDTLKPSTYTTTSTCTITDEEPTPYTTLSTLTITTYVPVLCASCTGGNYPHHTGKGPWEEEDKSVAVSGYGEYITEVGYTPTETELEGPKYTEVPTNTVYDDHEEEEYETETKSSTIYTDHPTMTKEREGEYETSPILESHRYEGKSSSAEYETYNTKTGVVDAHHSGSYTSAPSESTDSAYHSEYSKIVNYEHEYESTPASEHYTTVVPVPSAYDIPMPSYPSAGSSPVVSSSGYAPGSSYTATAPYSNHQVNGTKTAKGSATLSEYAPAEFTGGAGRMKTAWAWEAVGMGFFGVVFVL